MEWFSGFLCFPLALLLLCSLLLQVATAVGMMMREHRYTGQFPAAVAGAPTQTCLLAKAAFSLPAAAGGFTLH